MKTILRSFYLIVGFWFVQLILSGCFPQQYCSVRIPRVEFQSSAIPGGNFWADTLDVPAYHTDSVQLLTNFILEQYDCYSMSNHGFIQGAYASRPALPIYTLTEKITDIDIITVKDYNATHPAGSSLRDICMYKTSLVQSDTDVVNYTQLINYYQRFYEQKVAGMQYLGHVSWIREKPALNYDTIQLQTIIQLNNNHTITQPAKPFIVYW